MKKNQSATSKPGTRRNFLKQSALAIGAFAIVPRHVLGGKGFLAPSDTLTKGIIGVGGMGMGHIPYESTRVLAVCDVDKRHLEHAMKTVGGGVKGYSDFRELIAQPDIDIVHIATPPHWHALISIACAEAGMDVLCEKPMTRFIAEGRAVEAELTLADLGEGFFIGNGLRGLLPARLMP